MNTNPSETADFGDTMGEVAGEAETLLNKAEGAAAAEYNTALTKAAQQLRRAQAEFVRLEEAALVRAKDAARATDQAVHDYPYAAMGVAAAIGVLVGLAVPRR